MINIIIENIGANRGFIIVEKDNEQFIIASIDNDSVSLLANTNVKEEPGISQSIINYVTMSKQVVIVADAYNDDLYKNDTHVQATKAKSILVIPMIQNDKLKGMLYCENTLLSQVFSQKILNTTRMILSQLIISLDNAFVYENLETLVQTRTNELTKLNQNLTDSIQYAALIQQAILPQESLLDHYFSDYFILWQPRDMVGGDIYFINNLSEHELLVMVIDGAGHGVPGSFVTMLVKAIQTQIVSDIENEKLAPSPALLLSVFNQNIKAMLNQEKRSSTSASKSNAGFDGGILYYNKKTNKCQYAGAKTPLYIVNDKDLEVLKSDRANVGYTRTKMSQKYTDYDVTIKEGTKLYILTDGLTDQMDENDSLYSKSRFISFIQQVNVPSLEKQKEALVTDFNQHQGKAEQTDDITVLGLAF